MFFFRFGFRETRNVFHSTLVVAPNKQDRLVEGNMATLLAQQKRNHSWRCVCIFFNSFSFSILREKLGMSFFRL